MLLETDGVTLKTDVDPTPGLFTWVDDVSASSPTPYWTLGNDTDALSDDFTLTNHFTSGDTVPLRVQPNNTTSLIDLDVQGAVQSPLHLTGTTTRVSGFDSNNQHWLHADADGADPIVAFEQVATGNYNLILSKGDTTHPVLSTADEGSLDAGTLDGLDSTQFLQADGSVALTGTLNVGTTGFSGSGGEDISFTAAGTAAQLTTDGSGGGWTVWDAANATAHTEFREGGDLHVSSGTIYQQGTAVLTANADLGVDVENTNGTALVAGADAIAAGTDLSFSDDGDGTATLGFTGTVSPTSAAVGDTATKNGDGTTTTFSLGHNLGAVPDAASVEATSEAASTDFWISNTTSSAVDITYATPPPSGTGNLTYHIQTTASGLDAVTVSDDGATVLPNPGDLNFGTGLAAADDGDGTTTLSTDSDVPLLSTANTASGNWQFNAGLGVGPDTDLALTNSTATTQFAFAYDSANNRQVWADRANALPIAYVDRTGTVNFQQNVQLNGTDLATTGGDLSNSGSGSAPAEAVPEADGSGNIQWNRRTEGATTTANGDGSTTTFTIAHGLGKTPTAATVTPHSAAAMSDHYVSNLTSTDVVITYASAPPSGTSNLAWSVTVHE